MRLALAQLNSGPDVAANLAHCAAHMRAAAQAGAELIVFPENALFRGTDDGYRAHAQRVPGPLTARLAALSAELHIGAVWGSIIEAADGGLYNTTVAFDAHGALRAAYRKMHLFEFYRDGALLYRESDLFLFGKAPVVMAQPPFVLGFSICYDVRFPELFRALVERGANVLIVAADFVQTTGRTHWLPLLQARAIENLAYVVAVDQCGPIPDSDCHSHGNSCVISPWGEVLAQMDGATPGLCIAELTDEAIRAARARIHSLEHRQLYPEYAVDI